jgi:hypothetical protein
MIGIRLELIAVFEIELRDALLVQRYGASERRLAVRVQDRAGAQAACYGAQGGDIDAHEAILDLRG